MAEKRYSLKLDDVPKKDLLIRGVATRNPVLVQAIGLCPLIAVVNSAFKGLVIGVISAFILLVTEIIACAVLKKATRWVRVGIYALIGVLIMAPLYYLIEKYMPNLALSLGIYIPLLSVNSLSLFRCESFAVKTGKVRNAVFDALTSGLGYLLVLLATGIIREAFGSSKIFGYYIDFLPRAEGMLMPFAGFITIGFLSAFLNWFIKHSKLESLSEITLAKRINNDSSITLQPDIPVQKRNGKKKKKNSKASVQAKPEPKKPSEKAEKEPDPAQQEVDQTPEIDENPIITLENDLLENAPAGSREAEALQDGEQKTEEAEQAENKESE